MFEISVRMFFKYDDMDAVPKLTWNIDAGNYYIDRKDDEL